jgi:hypothetical protein
MVAQRGGTVAAEPLEIRRLVRDRADLRNIPRELEGRGCQLPVFDLYGASDHGQWIYVDSDGYCRSDRKHAFARVIGHAKYDDSGDARQSMQDPYQARYLDGNR